MYEVYRGYIGARGCTKRSRAEHDAKADLIAHAKDNPDYHGDTMRNGIMQPFILTRGGEQHTYNMICMPGDDLYAGDMIDAFGEKWIVMEARADATTHKTGVMQQCNQLFRFQNFTPEIIERWGYIDQSGYSSSVTGTNQMQKAEEQFAIYMPYDDDTAKLFVDKRLASHIGYDQFGHRILVTFKVTSCAPNTASFNTGDHLLSLKAIRDVYSETDDDLEQMICDYIAPSQQGEDQPGTLLPCSIIGAPKIMIGRTKTFQAAFYDSVGADISDSVSAKWNLPVMDGVTFYANGNTLKITVESKDALIGEEFSIALCDADGLYEPCSVMVEVGNIA